MLRAVPDRSRAMSQSSIPHSSGPVCPAGIDHIVLRVSDAPTMVAFYVGLLGCTLEWERADLGLIHLRAGTALIDLVDIAGPLGRKGGRAAGAEGRNLDHVCLALAHFDEAAIHSHLERHGVRFSETAQRFGASGMGPSLYLHDPEGNIVELKGPGDGQGISP
jgi:catechol 2,3-dioxygenase-like lactoylglutathione lyase family enzyme